MDYKKLAEQLKQKGLSNGSSLGHHSGLYDEAATAITELLARAENAEKKLSECEPVHAHWELDEYGDFRCSYCNGYASMDICRIHSVLDNFCRSCGAIMDEEE